MPGAISPIVGRATEARRFVPAVIRAAGYRPTAVVRSSTVPMGHCAFIPQAGPMPPFAVPIITPTRPSAIFASVWPVIANSSAFAVTPPNWVAVAACAGLTHTRPTGLEADAAARSWPEIAGFACAVTSNPTKFAAPANPNPVSPNKAQQRGRDHPSSDSSPALISSALCQGRYQRRGLAIAKTPRPSRRTSRC